MTDPFSIAGSGVGVISLGLTVFSGLLQYYGDWKDSEKDIAATYISIEGLTKTFMLIKDTVDGQSFRSDIVDRVTESLDSCSAGVQSLEKKLAKIRRTTPDKPGENLRAHARKAAYPFKKSTLMKLAEVVSDLRDNVSLAVDTLQLYASAFSFVLKGSLWRLKARPSSDVSTLSFRKIEDISARLATLVQQSQSASADITRGIAEVRLTQKEHDSRLLDQETLQIIRWLSPLNFGIRQKDVSSRRQQGAGKWLLQSDQFRMWLDGKINVLWCPGMPGAGKTVLASVIVDYLQQSTHQGGVGIGYVYCIYNAVDQTATNFMASLLQQLVQQQPVLSEDVTSLYNEHSREGTRPSLPEYLRLLQAHIQRFSRVFIVVDALDECSEYNGVRDLFLAQLRYLLPHISLLVTARDIASLDRAFEDATRLEIRANDEDLWTYLQVRIEAEALMESHIKEDRKLKDTIITNIIDKASGMFLLAELHLNSLINQDNRRSLRRALHSLPKELDKTYDDTMLRIDSQERQKVERAGQVLSWISCAERPLTVRELQCALAIEPEDTEFDEEAVPNENALLSVCCGLVVVEQESNIVRFVHFTTEKYIEQIRRTRYPSAQRLLSEVCLTYLSLKVFASGPYSEGNERHPWEIQEMVQTRLQVYHLLGYAAQHCGDHARKALEQGFNIEDLILDFLRARCSVGSSVQVVLYLDNGWHSARSYANISELHIAAGFGLDKLAGKFINQGTDVNARDYQGCTPLHRAAAKGHDATVRMLLDQGADKRAKDRSRSTALQHAASAGYETVVETLVGIELEVPTIFFRGISAIDEFSAAARNGHGKVLQVLLKHLEYDKRSAIIMGELLETAARSGQERVVSLLLEEGEGLEAFDMSKGKALGGAAFNNYTSVMGLLLEAGADINAVAFVGQTALQLAAERGHVAPTELLLDEGANLEIDSDYADIPLLIAAQRGHDKVISLLLDKGASVDATARNGQTALISAAKNGLVHVELLSDKQMLQSKDIREFFSLHAVAEHGHESVVEAFLEHGAEVNAKTEHSKTALILAAARGHTPAVKLLLKNGADIESNDGSQTALSLAARRGHTPVVELLLEHGADIESTGIDTTALVQAVSFVKTVQLLLQAGANVNGRDLGSDETSLHQAIGKYHNEEIVKMLIESGADLEAQNSKGETALVRAVRWGQVVNTQFLLEKGADPNAVEATVTPFDEFVYEVDFQTALKLVQEAKKTWKGKEPGSDTVEGHAP